MTTDLNARFAVDTYSYTLQWPAIDCLRALATRGYREFELQMYPGHLWPAHIDPAGRRALLSGHVEPLRGSAAGVGQDEGDAVLHGVGRYAEHRAPVGRDVDQELVAPVGQGDRRRVL